MINAIAAADIAFIISSSTSALIFTNPLGVFSSGTNWLNASLLFLRMNYVKNYNKTVNEFGVRLIS